MARFCSLAGALTLATALALSAAGCSSSLVEAAEDDDEASGASSDTADEVGDDTTEDTEESTSSEEGSSEESTEDSESSEDTTEETQGCEPGTVDCPCVDGMCEGEGLICVDDTCLMGEPYGQCGWDPRESYYDCGFTGADPSNQFPIDCGDLPLVPGSPCPPELTFEGCCTVGGDSYWCQEEKVERKVCGL